ncbi:MAG TPA: hypothetical protein VKV74_11255 [Bryobacteraceae bacterium]|nr:hypothetical protein [Bryobacteraceae bacterium]
MPRVSSPRLEKLAAALAVVTFLIFVLLQGKPYFTNASRPPRGIPDSEAAIQAVRSVEEVDDILGDAPSPDREVMRFKQRLDLAFMASHTGLLMILAIILSRQGGWASVAAAAAMAIAAAAAVFNVMQDLAILAILDVPLVVTTPQMMNAIRRPSAAKWALAALALTLMAALLWQKGDWWSRLTGALLLLTAVLMAYGLHDNRFFFYQRYAYATALIGIAGVYLPRWRGDF